MRISRRGLVVGSLGLRGARAGGIARQAAQTTMRWSFPIGQPGEVIGNGLVIRHGFACENTWYHAGWWHTGENWYLLDGAETAGMPVLSVADGRVVFAGSDYPGRVVIIEHESELYSMYGHLDYNLAVAEGDSVERGQEIGTILYRTDGRAPSHLHFEIRTFLTRDEINGNNPQYGVACGYQCPPGPGYWPMNAPELPVDLGWRNPTHAVAVRFFGDGKPGPVAGVIVAAGAEDSTAIWSEPSDHEDAQELGELELVPGDRYRLISVATGDPATRQTSAESYRLWFRIELADGDRVWVPALRTSTAETGSDGRPSMLRLQFLPQILS